MFEGDHDLAVLQRLGTGGVGPAARSRALQTVSGGSEGAVGRPAIVPGLLELLGVVVVGQWSWKNLTTSDKRNALVQRVQTLRKEYLG